MARFQSPTGSPIVGLLEQVRCRATVSDISEDGTEVQYDGNTDVWWDEQAPVMRGNSFAFLDEDGEEWTFDQLTKVED